MHLYLYSMVVSLQADLQHQFDRLACLSSKTKYTIVCATCQWCQVCMCVHHDQKGLLAPALIMSTNMCSHGNMHHRCKNAHVYFWKISCVATANCADTRKGGCTCRRNRLFLNRNMAASTWCQKAISPAASVCETGGSSSLQADQDSGELASLPTWLES